MRVSNGQAASKGPGGENVQALHMNRVLTALAAAGVLAALLFGSVTAAQATPISRANAVRAAKNYLRVSAFSFKGLVKQLKYEGYSTNDARYGASHAGANWMKQAVRAARQYLKVSAFSRSGMIGQLEYDGFTHAQAVHGALAVGL
jgi:Host cell surface-exposed lipoprotein